MESLRVCGGSFFCAGYGVIQSEAEELPLSIGRDRAEKSRIDPSSTRQNRPRLSRDEDVNRSGRQKQRKPQRRPQRQRQPQRLPGYAGRYRWHGRRWGPLRGELFARGIEIEGGGVGLGFYSLGQVKMGPE